MRVLCCRCLRGNGLNVLPDRWARTKLPQAPCNQLCSEKRCCAAALCVSQISIVGWAVMLR